MLTTKQYYMLWFAGVVTVCFFVALLSRLGAIRRPNRLLTDPLPNPLGFILVAAIFGIFSGLRDEIGDTGQYIDIYQRMDVEHMEPIRFQIGANTMFRFLEYRIHLRTDETLTLIMLTALVAIIPAIYILYRYAAPFEIAVALFVLTGYYSASMNGIRQYLAAGILLMGTRFLFSDREIDFLKYAVFILVAWTFHSTALIMIPIFFIVRRPAWRPLIFALLGGTVIATLLFDRFLPTFLNAIEDTEYGAYVTDGWFTKGEETGSSIIRVFVLLVPLVLAYLWHGRLEEIIGRKWDILVNLSVFNLMFYILSLYNWLFARLAIYTSLYVIVMMTHLLDKGVPRQQSNYLKTAMIGLYIFYFYNLRYTIIEYHSLYF